jgi:dipeptidyl-peptidase-4
MKKLFILAFISLLFSCKQPTSNNSNQASRTEKITLEDIWGSTFSTNRMNALNSMNGDYYSLLNRDENGFTTVDQYSYLNLEKVATIVDGKTLNSLQKFESYSFNNDESKLILGKDIQKVYRRSTKGTYYIYSVNSKKIRLIGEHIQEPTFSPDSKKVAYAKNNNLFILNLTTNTTRQVTYDGKYNHIINGTTDWVYEEEFGFVRAFEWSKDSKFIAFLRFNESKVKEFSMGVTGNQLYPTQHVFKYPKAGEDNAKVSLHTYNLETRKLKKIALGSYEYIPRIQWSNTNPILIATTLNRHQNDLKIHKVNALKSSSSLLLNEKDDAYVSVKNDLTFLDDNSFIWTSEKDGYNHIYHYDFNGKLINQITNGSWEVTKYYGFNKDKKTIYYQSVENGAINRGIYSVRLDGTNKKLLSNNAGTNTAAFSRNLNYFINTHSTSETPPIYSLYSAEGIMIKVIKDNSSLEDKLLNYRISPKEFSTININGNDLNMWMIKPLDFDEQKKYPLLMFQYSGPGSQQVSNKWKGTNDYWHQLLAQQGMIIACVDGRGTGLKGRDFQKNNSKRIRVNTKWKIRLLLLKH